MFCTTFLSAPSEELAEGGPLPGGCLAPLHCLVLPQDELYGPISEPAARLSLRHAHGCSALDVGHLLLNSAGQSPASSSRSQSSAGTSPAASPAPSWASDTGRESQGREAPQSHNKAQEKRKIEDHFIR